MNYPEMDCSDGLTMNTRKNVTCLYTAIILVKVKEMRTVFTVAFMILHIIALKVPRL